MGKLFMIAVLVVGGGLAPAQDLGTHAPQKSPVSSLRNIPNPVRQAGDTLDDALLIPSVPYSDTGTTAGYTDDYDEVCPYMGSVAPDVVYRYVPASDQSLDLDLCNSAYDTKLYVYDTGLNLVACNDDFYFWAPCFEYSSKLENVALAAGQTYYIIIDGYGAAFGDYVINVDAHVPCAVTCPDEGCPENEPPLVPDYIDVYNGGCNTTPSYPFQHIAGAGAGWGVPLGSWVLCGVSGWYTINGVSNRDSDWYTMTVGASNRIEITADAEYATYIFELTGTCAGGVSVVQQAIAGPCSEGTLTITGAAGWPKWFWVGPTVFTSPDGTMMYDYVVWFGGLAPEIPGGRPCRGPLMTEPTSWGEIKALYR
jgi:hypothetical protein